MKRLLALFLAVPAVLPGSFFLGFEELPDGNVVNDFYAGFSVKFQNATVLTKGIGLSPIFPPAGGLNVATDLPGSPMVMTFPTPATSFSAYFTWTAPIHFFVAYTSGAVDTLNPANPANFSGAEIIGGMTDPNKQISFAKASGIDEIDISTDVPGNSFTIDNVTVESVPEPSVCVSLASGFVALALRRARRGEKLHPETSHTD